MLNCSPLLYGVRRAVVGTGFLAGVDIKGRALLEYEDDAWWVVGVQPGGVLASGDTPSDAWSAFKDAVTAILFDSAGLAQSFDAFAEDVTMFGTQRNEVAGERWSEARTAVQDGDEPKENFVAELPRNKGETPSGVSVVRLDEAKRQFKPQDNKLDRVYLPAA